jgi:hypothetical protein
MTLCACATTVNTVDATMGKRKRPMSTLAETMTSERAITESTPHPDDPDCSVGLVENIRDEFLEMPGLSLTLPQAARLFGMDIRRSKQLLKTLLDEGFLVRDTRSPLNSKLHSPRPTPPRVTWPRPNSRARANASWPRSSMKGSIGCSS